MQAARARFSIPFVLLFLSAATGRLHQVVWTRLVGEIFGVGGDLSTLCAVNTRGLPLAPFP